MSYQAQLLESLPAEGTHVAVEPSGYFDAPVESIDADDLRRFDLDPEQGPMHRHSYLYQLIYKIGKNEYGGIQLRARTWTHAPTLNDRFKEVIRQTAHRAAHLYNSTTETPDYAGYLSGFNPFDPVSDWEHEEVQASDREALAGKVDWNTEIYVSDSFAMPDLSGIAQGIANPWYTETEEKREEPPREEYKLNYLPSRDEYEIKTRSGARGRGKTVLPGKTVYVNNKPVAEWKKSRGRASIKAEYKRPPTLPNGRQRYDRQRLIDETSATPQALRDGGTLYKTEETTGAIYFVTRSERPDEWDATPSDEIPDTQGVEITTVTRLRLRGRTAASSLEARRDERVIRHMGLSDPEYSHAVTREWSL